MKPTREKQVLRTRISLQILDFTLVFFSEKSKSLLAVYAFMTVMNKGRCQKKQRLNTKNVLVVVRYKIDASTTTTTKSCRDISKLSIWFLKSMTVHM